MPFVIVLRSPSSPHSFSYFFKTSLSCHYISALSLLYITPFRLNSDIFLPFFSFFHTTTYQQTDRRTQKFLNNVFLNQHCGFGGGVGTGCCCSSQLRSVCLPSQLCFYQEQQLTNMTSRNSSAPTPYPTRPTRPTAITLFPNNTSTKLPLRNATTYTSVRTSISTIIRTTLVPCESKFPGATGSGCSTLSFITSRVPANETVTVVDGVICGNGGCVGSPAVPTGNATYTNCNGTSAHTNYYPTSTAAGSAGNKTVTEL